MSESKHANMLQEPTHYSVPIKLIYQGSPDIVLIEYIF